MNKKPDNSIEWVVYPPGESAMFATMDGAQDWPVGWSAVGFGSAIKAYFINEDKAHEFAEMMNGKIPAKTVSHLATSMKTEKLLEKDC